MLAFGDTRPHIGVARDGREAGVCEAIERSRCSAGGIADGLCSRCGGGGVRAAAHAPHAHIKHLGPRRSALSSMVWHESLVAARRHLVMPAAARTGAERLCLAGHDCSCCALTLG